jgi:site-specific recombinase XerD
MAATASRVSDGPDVSLPVSSFEPHLRATNGAPRTIRSYGDTVRRFAAFLRANGMPTCVTKITREQVETYIAEQARHWKPKTAQIRFGDLQLFFKWAAEDPEVTSSPMVNMRRPQVPEEPTPGLGEDQLRALFKTCEGTSFDDRRDMTPFRSASTPPVAAGLQAPVARSG